MLSPFPHFSSPPHFDLDHPWAVITTSAPPLLLSWLDLLVTVLIISMNVPEFPQIEYPTQNILFLPRLFEGLLDTILCLEGKEPLWCYYLVSTDNFICDGAPSPTSSGEEWGAFFANLKDQSIMSAHTMGLCSHFVTTAVQTVLDRYTLFAKLDWLPWLSFMNIDRIALLKCLSLVSEPVWTLAAAKLAFNELYIKALE
ncbi:uncharacterized protein LAESUDRAFT_765412 [Laetiporus sulphureus 93-53]|uniref:Uncharacterized protein n=1 Tax=Laetiporus sulphureus 93-53 TaxID=1314785 RepID=A0A165AS35_9APHY|nr:uncharacterized protein LAESUDRAFT_765412 [Laetiporus sulphureus 93-53]KZS99552.1 hypothetical protein LAESUDRAFT_765412 [Laetiporus sulphureus 93-53]